MVVFAATNYEARPHPQYKAGLHYLNCRPAHPLEHPYEYGRPHQANNSKAW